MDGEADNFFEKAVIVTNARKRWWKNVMVSHATVILMYIYSNSTWHSSSIYIYIYIYIYITLLFEILLINQSIVTTNLSIYTTLF